MSGSQGGYIRVWNVDESKFEGVFAGTRGLARPITGVCVRVAAALAEAFALEVRGLFVGGVAVDARGGENCVAPTDAELRGLQVTLRPAAPKP